MPPIEGNFDKRLELLDGGKGVAARGPLSLGDEGTSAVVHAAIMQNDATAIGHTGDDVPRTASVFLFEALVDGDKPLTPGPAIATGMAVVRGKGVEMYQWSARVELFAKNGAAAPHAKHGHHS